MGRREGGPASGGGVEGVGEGGVHGEEPWRVAAGGGSGGGGGEEVPAVAGQGGAGEGVGWEEGEDEGEEVGW